MHHCLLLPDILCFENHWFIYFAHFENCFKREGGSSSCYSMLAQMEVYFDVISRAQKSFKNTLRYSHVPFTHFHQSFTFCPFACSLLVSLLVSLSLSLFFPEKEVFESKIKTSCPFILKYVIKYVSVHILRKQGHPLM